jgi:hypothetical protein
MEIHRVKHGTIPVSDFKADEVTGSQKVLRRFQNEMPTPNDARLRVEDERDGKFVLWAHYVSFPENIGEDGRLSAKTGADSLDQPTVDKIEVSPNIGPAQDCDFVIFQDSPESRADCHHKGQ